MKSWNYHKNHSNEAYKNIVDVLIVKKRFINLNPNPCPEGYLNHIFMESKIEHDGRCLGEGILYFENWLNGLEKVK
jgi:hypothetical protein